jgi:hypothetical protein
MLRALGLLTQGIRVIGQSKRIKGCVEEQSQRRVTRFTQFWGDCCSEDSRKPSLQVRNNERFSFSAVLSLLCRSISDEPYFSHRGGAVLNWNLVLWERMRKAR